MKRLPLHHVAQVREGLLEGVPLREIALEMELGPCIMCGKEPDASGGGLANLKVDAKGVLRGDNVCIDCLREQADESLPIIEAFLNDDYEA